MTYLPGQRKEFIGMKINRNTIMEIILGVIFSVFMGITAGSMGFGSWFPQLNLVARPFVCPNQQMSYAQNVTQIGADTYWTAAWACVDEKSGVNKALDRNTVLMVAGVFYGLVIFVVLVIWYRWGSRQPQQSGTQSEQSVSSPADDRRARKAAADIARVRADDLARMKQLKEMRVTNLISEIEYEQKRAEILKDM